MRTIRGDVSPDDSGNASRECRECRVARGREAHERALPPACRRTRGRAPLPRNPLPAHPIALAGGGPRIVRTGQIVLAGRPPSPLACRPPRRLS